MIYCWSNVTDSTLHPAGYVVGRNLFFVEGESECTGERACGQFSIFGAVEENVCHGFSRMDTDQEFFQECLAKPR
jgi:hypothetical protein